MYRGKLTKRQTHKQRHTYTHIHSICTGRHAHEDTGMHSHTLMRTHAVRQTPASSETNIHAEGHTNYRHSYSDKNIIGAESDADEHIN